MVLNAVIYHMIGPRRVEDIERPGRSAPLNVADVMRLKDEHEASVAPLQALRREALALERRVSDAVNAAYGLTPADVKLMWQTAPPRMPLAPPSEG